MTKEQWAIKQSYALDADKLSRQLLDKSLALNATVSSSKNIEVINTNGWERSEVITVPASISELGDKVKDSNGKPVLSQRLSNGDLAIWVKAVPAFSSRQYQISKGKATRENPIKAEGNTLDNGQVSVKLNPQNGSILELISSANKNLNFVDAASGYGLNDYAFLDSVKMDNILRASNVKITVKEHGPLVASLLIESDAAGCNKLTRKVRLTAGSENVELINTVDKKRAQISKKPGERNFAQKGGKESVNFAFPFNVHKGTIHLDVPYGVMEPEKDQIASACKNWLTINRWADVSNQESGIALISMDAPLIEVGGITAVMLGSQTNPKVWRKHIEPTQTIFSWVMNNHWGTNYRAYQEGLITFRYLLVPHKQFQPDEISKYAIGISQPLLVKRASEIKAVYQNIVPNHPGVLITALKPCDDGKGNMVTLFNSTNNTLKTKLLSNNLPIQSVWESNSGEEKILKLGDNLELPAWGTVMLRIE
jgi:alpha-mannosidase